jgi:DNA-binding transcriptional LysR family regulator
MELAEPVADILARVGSVLARAVPFDPATSSRRFVIGAPDAVMAAVMSPLMGRVRADAPNVGIGLIHLMPGGRSAAAAQPWEESLRKLEKREIDVALLPVRTAPPRFATRRLYEEDFVVAMRKGHPFARSPSEAKFCSARHLLVSLSGEAYGFVDEALAKRGLERRIVLTVPTFMLALSHLAESDLVATLPRRLVERHAGAFGLTSVELPFKRKPDPIHVIATRAAMMDAGVAWLMDAIVAAASQP